MPYSVCSAAALPTLPHYVDNNSTPTISSNLS
jgi:hypothetical protein